MEKKIKIKTPDNFVIYGTYSSSKHKTGKIVIFVHGFTGHQNEHIFFNGAKYFNNKGFDSFRFDLYSYEKKSRPFKDTKISLHGKDIRVVIDYFKNKYKKIYLVGHSYVGTSLLFVGDNNVSGMTFWDASYIEPVLEDYFVYSKSLNSYILKDRIDYIVGKKFVEELKKFPDCGELISKIHVPVKFITAGEKGNGKSGKKYFSKANKPKESSSVAGASHCFDELGTEEKLFEETLKWFKKY